MAKIREMDAAGELKRNLINPVYKDNVIVYAGGYTIIRFTADNPGTSCVRNVYAEGYTLIRFTADNPGTSCVISSSRDQLA
jgi:hypothetical protein